MHAVGLDLGGTNIKVGLVERGAGLVEATTLTTDAENGPDTVVAQMAEGVRQVLSHHPNVVSGIGVGAPGAVSWDRTTVLAPPNFPGWETIDLAAALRAQLPELGDVPIIVENDANVAGLGSAFYGAGRPFDSFLMVTLGTGVGGAIIYQNKLFRGMTGAAGEIGHVVIDYEGPPDRTGVSGVLEAYLGQRFLSRHARYRLMNTDSPVKQHAAPDLLHITPRLLYDAAVEGDPDAAEVLAWAGHKLGVALGSCVNLLDLRKIVVGGGVSAAGDLILEPARKALLQYVMPGLRGGVELVQETLGNEVGMLGAARLIFEHHEG